MIHFPPLRTQRFTAQMHEISIGAAITLAAMPVDQHEATITGFLAAVVGSATGLQDQSQWTVQERTLAVCHYLAATAPDGPDFAVGSGRFSSYFDGATDRAARAEVVEVGTIGGDHWRCRHLTGAMAEGIERLRGTIPGLPGALHWRVGCMAAQLILDDPLVPDPQGFDAWLLERMQVLLGYPESDFLALLCAWLDGCDKLAHLFRLDLSDDGLMVLPQEGAGALPPARFRADTCLTGVTLGLVR